jgi:hypothetical protein
MTAMTGTPLAPAPTPFSGNRLGAETSPYLKQHAANRPFGAFPIGHLALAWNVIPR